MPVQFNHAAPQRDLHYETARKLFKGKISRTIKCALQIVKPLLDR